MRLSQLLSGLGSQPLAVMCAQLGGGGGRHQMEFTGKEREQLFGCKKKRIENGPANSPLCVYNEEMNRKAPKIPAPLTHTHTSLNHQGAPIYSRAMCTQIAKSWSKAKISISSRWASVKFKKRKFQKVLAELLKFKNKNEKKFSPENIKRHLPELRDGSGGRRSREWRPGIAAVKRLSVNVTVEEETQFDGLL